MRHAPYCHLWFAQHCFHVSSQRVRFSQNVTEHKMCVFLLSTTFVWNISHSKKKWARYDEKCIMVFTWSASYSCQILMKLELSRQIFEKYPKFSFMKSRPVGAELYHADRQTDKHGVNSRFSQFCERAAKNPNFWTRSAFIRCVWISEETAIISPYSTNRLVFITETECVYCAVRTGYLNKITVKISLKSYKWLRPRRTRQCT
jgi:hypothetical protein